MLEISVLRAIPEIERKERQTESFVLRDVSELVAPHSGRRLEARDDHVAERDRAEPASGQDEIREAAVAHVEKATVLSPRPSEGQQSEDMSDRIGVMRDEGPAEVSGDGGDHVVDGGQDPRARGHGRIEMHGDEPGSSIGFDRSDAIDLPAAREDVLGAAHADELENIDRDLIVRARDECRPEAGRAPSVFDAGAAAGAQKHRAREEQAKARTHGVIVRPGLASPRVR